MRKHLPAAQIVFPLLAMCWVAFIFWNSAKPGPVSGQTSQAIVSSLTGQPVEQNNIALEWMVRKAGHVGEYTLLGLLLGGCLSAFGKLGQRWQAAFFALGTTVAAADELFQRTVPGRSGQLSDVVLDAASIVLGLFLARWGIVRWQKYQSQRKKS